MKYPFTRFGLQQKNILFIILPTFIILSGMGLFGLSLVRTTLINQWDEIAVSKLQSSAHVVDMRLMRPKELLQFLQQESSSELDLRTNDIIIKQLRSLDGVVQVKQEWYGDNTVFNRFQAGKHSGMMGLRYHHFENLEVTAPQYDTEFKNETVSLTTYFKDNDDKRLGHIEVVISFYDLIDQVVQSSWWKSYKAYIVGHDGTVLSSTLTFDEQHSGQNGRKFGALNDLEKRTLAAMQAKAYGTVFGSGVPPKEVSGFYRLTEAPWTFVVIAPGEKVLKPIITFRSIYFLIGTVGILLALFIIRVATSRTTRAIRLVSEAANNLAAGNFGEPIQNRSRDEVGELTRNFNAMSRQLQKGASLQEAMNVAREVQQNLLPGKIYKEGGVEVSGLSLYCDETGGDYYDYFPSPVSKERLFVVLGDVVGHGVGAALLMATVRSLVRGRTSQPGTLAEIITDVNRLLCLDTEESNNFVTLYFLEVDTENRVLKWVRAGHDPAIIYCPSTNAFSEAKGKGVALGIDPQWMYEENEIRLPNQPHYILIGSDGAWEVENESGECFGKERLKNALAANHHLSSESILKHIVASIEEFRGSSSLQDDVTLALIKLF